MVASWHIYWFSYFIGRCFLFIFLRKTDEKQLTQRTRQNLTYFGENSEDVCEVGFMCYPQHLTPRSGLLAVYHKPTSTQRFIPSTSHCPIQWPIDCVNYLSQSSTTKETTITFNKQRRLMVSIRRTLTKSSNAIRIRFGRMIWLRFSHNRKKNNRPGFAWHTHPK